MDNFAAFVLVLDLSIGLYVQKLYLIPSSQWHECEILRFRGLIQFGLGVLIVGGWKSGDRCRPE